MRRVSSFSPKEAKNIMSDTNSEFLTRAESLDLVKRIAKEYKLKNLRIEYQDIPGLFGKGGKDQGNFPIVGRPTYVFLQLSPSIMCKHTVLHEMSHVIDFWKFGTSSHGKRFQSIYQKLLNKHHKGIKL